MVSAGILAHHYNDAIMGVMTSQITSLANVYSAVYSSADQRKHQSSLSLAFVRAIHRWSVNSPHKWPVTWNAFPFDDVIMCNMPNMNYMYGTGVGVTKPISSVPLFSDFFSIIKTHATYWISRLYLTGIAAAQLRWHLSNINVIRII